MRILVVGGGGREHGLCWAMAASPLCTKLFCAPGNAGIAQVAECVEVGAEDIPGQVAPAEAYIRKQGAPIVVKADGLAAGKGVIVAETVEQALDAERDMLSGNRFGAAGASVVIEEFMEGEEVSLFALSDGEHVLPLVGAQDHKRAFDGDKGPNTG